MKFHLIALPSKPPFCCIEEDVEWMRVRAVYLDHGEKQEFDTKFRRAEAADLRVVAWVLMAELVTGKAPGR